MSLKQF